jgi:hypothetical protein
MFNPFQPATRRSRSMNSTILSRLDEDKRFQFESALLCERDSEVRKSDHGETEGQRRDRLKETGTKSHTYIENGQYIYMYVLGEFQITERKIPTTSHSCCFSRSVMGMRTLLVQDHRSEIEVNANCCHLTTIGQKGKRLGCGQIVSLSNTPVFSYSFINST